MADAICRWRNGTPKTVMELVNSMPHVEMPVNEFRTIMANSIQWGSSFFRTAYQLAVQLALYYESDEGYFIPRFDHNINEAEAEAYLYSWFPKYYVPNPYISKDGFNKITCPTLFLKSLYDYAKLHPNCTYKDAYESVFKEPAKNNDDIIRNYINNYGQVLTFSRDGILNITNVNPDKIFPIMDRNDKKAFFESFNLDHTATRELQKVDLNFLAAIKTKPFLILGGFSGTGKSQKVKELAFLTCPNDDEMRKKLGNTENTPGNYCLVSVRPNWHDSTDLLGYYSSINDKYIVTDFVRFLVKAMQYKDIPFFVCLDEMNLAPVEEYFAEFLSVLESRKKVGDEILTDPLLSADWFNKKYKEYNIFDDLGLKRIGREQSKGENRQAGLLGVVDEEPFDRMDIVESLQKNGLCLPQNVVVIGTVNMDDTTNSFSRKVIDRAMTFETIVEEFGDDYYNTQDTMTYGSSKKGDWMWILPDEVRANEALEHASDLLDDGQKKEVTNFINEVNMCLKGSPFQIAYRILNETILYYRATKIVNQGEAELNKVFDDILMQKVLPRIEGDYDKTYKPLAALKTKAETKGWTKSKEKIDFMLDRFSKDDQGGFTSFWN